MELSRKNFRSWNMFSPGYRQGKNPPVREYILSIYKYVDNTPTPSCPSSSPTTWHRWGKQGARITARYLGVNTNSVLALANEVALAGPHFDFWRVFRLEALRGRGQLKWWARQSVSLAAECWCWLWRWKVKTSSQIWLFKLELQEDIDFQSQQQLASRMSQTLAVFQAFQWLAAYFHLSWQRPQLLHHLKCWNFSFLFFCFVSIHSPLAKNHTISTCRRAPGPI